MIVACIEREKKCRDASKGHAMSGGNSSFQAESPSPHTFIHTHVRTQMPTSSHLNPGKNCSPYVSWKRVRKCVCVWTCIYAWIVHLTVIPLHWIPRPDELSLTMLLLLLLFMSFWLVWPVIIIFQIAVNVTTPLTASRCACGMRTTTSNHGWSSISSASQTISWVRPSSRFALSVERWTFGII